MASNNQPADFYSIAELQPTEEGSVHSIVANISLMKKGATAYFEADLQ